QRLGSAGNPGESDDLAIGSGRVAHLFLESVQGPAVLFRLGFGALGDPVSRLESRAAGKRDERQHGRRRAECCHGWSWWSGSLGLGRRTCRATAAASEWDHAQHMVRVEAGTYR